MQRDSQDIRNVKRGSRWLSEVTEVTLKNQNIIEYGFYILDKKTGNEYEAKAIVQNNDNANWTVKFRPVNSLELLKTYLVPQLFQYTR